MKKLGVILLILVFVAFLVASYFTFIYKTNCPDIHCWRTKLEGCNKARYISDGGDIIWIYEIKGKENDKCIVNVEVMRIVRGLDKTRAMEGMSMDCYLPLGVYVAPERNPNICHGRLKEEIQTLMIEKLHQYVLDNIGEIGSGADLGGVIGGEEILGNLSSEN